jgi:uncharacterized membrane protein
MRLRCPRSYGRGMTDSVTQMQIDAFGRRLDALTAEFEELKRGASTADDDWELADVATLAEPEAAPLPFPVRAAQPTPAPQREPRPPRRQVELADLLGPRALAIAGGIVTLLGIVFFFVLAVNRGWLGDGGRVALGGTAATLVFVGGLELRRRYGTTHSALAAVSPAAT